MFSSALFVFVLASLSGVVVSQVPDCGYHNCLYWNATERNSSIETYTVFFNFTKLPDIVISECKRFFRAYDRCSHIQDNCPEELSEGWDNRLFDNHYIKFLTRIGVYTCKRAKIVKDLRECASRNLENAMKSCVYGNYTFDPDCLHDKYNDHEQCGKHVDRMIHELIDKYLPSNPFNNHSSIRP